MSKTNLLMSILILSRLRPRINRHPRTVRRWMNKPTGDPTLQSAIDNPYPCADRAGVDFQQDAQSCSAPQKRKRSRVIGGHSKRYGARS